MDVNRLLLIIIMIATMLLGTIVILKSKRSPINISFGILTITIVIWTFCNFMILNVWQYKSPIEWVKTAYAFGTLMATCFAIFSFIFSYESLQPAKKIIKILIPLCIIMFLLALTKYSITNMDYKDGDVKNVKYGIGNIIWGIYVIFCLSLIQYSLIVKWRRGNKVERLRITYMYFGIVITTTIMLITNIILPFLGYPKAIGYGPVSTIIMIGCIAYAIVKHRLMNIRLFIKKGIVYSILLAGGAVVMSLLVLEIPNAIPNLGWVQSAIVILMGGIFIVFAIRPFIDNIRDFVNVFIFTDQHRYQLVLNDFSASASKILDINRLFELIFNTITESMKVDKASLLSSDNNGSFKIFRSSGLEHNEQGIILTNDNAIISQFKKNHGPIIKDEIGKSIPTDVFDAIESDLKILKSEISMPLFADNELIAIVNLGTKPHGSMYFDEDISFLRSIISQSSVAIQNAKLHQQVVNMEKLSFLGRLSAELAHEIKNPLVTIKTAFEFLVSQNNNPDEAIKVSDDFKEFLNLAMSETDRINNLIRQLLYLGRPSPPKLAWCNINQILSDTLLSHKRSINENDIELIDLRDNKPIDIYADKDQIRQVMLNITQNALDAMKNGGKLTIKTDILMDSDDLNKNSKDPSTSSDKSVSNSNVIIEISDTGKGMSQEELKDIFEPFYTKKLTGTGLGLAIVSSIIREHKGIIEVESIEGSGTKFIIQLPQIYQAIQTAKF